MNRIRGPFSAVALAAGLLLLAACVPATQGPGPVSTLPAHSPSEQQSEEELLFSRLNTLGERADSSGLTESEEAALASEIQAAFEAFLAAPPAVRNSPRNQAAMERLADLTLQVELDANAAPPAPPPSEEGTPLEALLTETTFLPEGDLQATLEAVRRAQASVQLNLPVPSERPEVLAYVNLYQNRYRNWFAATLERSAPWAPTLQRIFKDEGVPPELIYLAAVESAFRTDAVSRAKAVGMWQFIAGTAKRYDLAVDYWEDQRLDPEVAARASARYLKDLYDLFGDWPLALASYNAGEGKIMRWARTKKDPSFWELRKTTFLRRETREYVPAIFAAVLIATNPEAYGFARPQGALEPYAAVPLSRAMDLRLLSRCADLPVEVLRAQNPSLKRLVTPPRPFRLKLPPERVERFQAALAAVPENEQLAVAVHTVGAGETLQAIARRYQVSASLLRTVNRLASSRVKPGTQLAIPTGSSASDPTLYAEERGQKRPAQRIYKVRRGDTLASIASRTGVSVEALKEMNHIQGSSLRVGQRLVLSAGQPRPTPAPGTSRPAPPKGARVHHVAQGDSLYQLALTYGTTVDKICRLNRISRGKILRLGDTLLIPE